MGETGCGKTCLIRYMCGLQSGPGGPKNMLLMKVQIERYEQFIQYFFCEPFKLKVIVLLITIVISTKYGGRNKC